MITLAHFNGTPHNKVVRTIDISGSGNLTCLATVGRVLLVGAGSGEVCCLKYPLSEKSLSRMPIHSAPVVKVTNIRKFFDVRSPFDHHSITIRSPLDHHSITTRSPLDHHSITPRLQFDHHLITIRSPLDHHSITTRSPLDHHSITPRLQFDHHSITT